MESSASDISQVIQLAVAPVFLLAGIGAFINAFANRLARTFDRSRHLEALLDDASPERFSALKNDLALLRRRARLAYVGIALGTLAALLVCLLIAVAFIGYLFNFYQPDQPGHISQLIRDLTAGLFLAAMLSLIGGLVAFLREISMAVKNLRIGRD